MMISGRTLFASLIFSLPVYAETPLAVNVVVAQSVEDVRVNALIGEIVARNTLTASFPAGGRLASVDVEQGDKVAAGAVLARMESVRQEQALRAAEAGVATAQADFRQAQADLVRQNALIERGATTRIARDAAEDALTISEGVLAQAQADFDQARKALDDTVLLAPAAAEVTDRMGEPGQVLGAAQPVVKLALGTDLDAIFDVPEALLTSETHSETIQLDLLDSTDAGFSGTVREVSPLVDASTGTVEVTVSVQDAPAGASYGDAVRGTVRLQVDDRMALPFTAMSATKDGPAVWVVNPETRTVSLQQVDIDRFETARMILKAGLEEGTIVVTDGAQLLYPGRTVTYQEPTK
ncbi:efflux RND transporter periplasmic adaptor subunit [Sulfitobacter sp. SK011]|uniref:efflux RND transporter periplasmic adaptor subunit n=1 Tax=Sulfitobacter sp. SK011 TaxID=1389004 RepID=UPI0013B366DD|nr:efflux RND transporter periplasmic adaptor subunit [Sulfitobacter sp. SK011]